MMNIIEDVLKKNGSKAVEIQLKTVEVEKAIDNANFEYRQKIDEMLSAGSESKERGQISQSLPAMDTAIAKGREFQADMQELIEELTRELENLGRKVTQSNDYNGFEKMWKFIGKMNKANKLRIERIKNNNVEESMNIVIDFAKSIIESLQHQVDKNKEIYLSLEEREQAIIKKLNDSQPKYEEWRESVRSLTIQMEDVDRKIREADGCNG